MSLFSTWATQNSLNGYRIHFTTEMRTGHSEYRYENLLKIISNDSPCTVGFGLYHYLAIGICCACVFSNATAIMIVPFAIPIMACDMEVSQKMLVLIHVALSVGKSSQFALVLKYRLWIFFRHGYRWICLWLLNWFTWTKSSNYC